MVKNNITVSYSGCSITQIYKNNTFCHAFYKNNKKLYVTSKEHCIPRSTKKQLYRYLRYLVNNNIFDSFKVKQLDDGFIQIPTELNEYTSTVRYTSVTKGFSVAEYFLNEED